MPTPIILFLLYFSAGLFAVGLTRTVARQLFSRRYLHASFPFFLGVVEFGYSLYRGRSLPEAALIAVASIIGVWLGLAIEKRYFPIKGAG